MLAREGLHLAGQYASQQLTTLHNRTLGFPSGHAPGCESDLLFDSAGGLLTDACSGSNGSQRGLAAV
jgi:hypothetical protein